MKLKSFLSTTLVTLLYLQGKAQEISFKTEYIGKSGYYYTPPGENTREKIGDGKGSAIVYQAGVNIPVSIKMNENNRPTAWGIGFGGSYVSLKNQRFSEQMESEIMNFQLGIYHLRPLNDKWSIRASVGMGIFTPSTNLSEISFKNVLASGGIVFIRHLNPNLSIGGGISINSALGYPMVFPAFYLSWNTEGKLDVNIELIEGLDMSVGYDFNDKFKLSYAFGMDGQLALLKKDGKDVIFSHQYIVTGFRPEIKIDKKLTAIGMAGLNLFRPVSYTDRTWKGVFGSDNNYYFAVSPYVSVSLKMKL